MSISQILSAFTPFWPSRSPLPSPPSLPAGDLEWIRSLPKAEIHVHFEGSITNDTILHLAEKYGVPEIPNRKKARALFRFTNAHQFFQNFLFVSYLLREPEDFYQAARQIGNRYKEEHIRYAEITLAPHKYIRLGIAYKEIMESIDAGLQEASPETEFRYIIDIVRDLGPELGMDMIRHVEACPFYKVIGIGLGGSEAFPPADSKPVFAYAASIGLKKTAHAGEGKGAGSVWETLQQLNVDRIDHGIRSIEDDRLMDFLQSKQIPLNLCLSSNVALRVVRSIRHHPIRAFYEKGIPVNLSTDDPTFFQTTLTDEYARLLADCHFTRNELVQIAANAFQASFLCKTEKNTWINHLSKGNENTRHE